MLAFLVAFGLLASPALGAEQQAVLLGAIDEYLVIATRSSLGSDVELWMVKLGFDSYRCTPYLSLYAGRVIKMDVSLMTPGAVFGGKLLLPNGQTCSITYLERLKF